MRICLFPGTFDPLTLGHVDIIHRALKIFDKVVIGIGVNSSKTPMFPLEQRLEWIKKTFEDTSKVEGKAYDGLTVNFCKKINARFIVRGIRYMNDFEYEKVISDMNYELDHDIETVFLTGSAHLSSFSSTLVREVYRNKGNVSKFLPPTIQLPGQSE